MTMMARNTEGALEHGSQGANGAAHLRDVSGDPSVSGEVMVHGVLEEVSWRTRTAVLYTEDDTAVTVRFTADQDGWMRLVANYPVRVQGTARYDAEGALEALDLVRVYVTERVFRPYDAREHMDVCLPRPYGSVPHPPIDWGELSTDRMSTEEFMEFLRSDEHKGAAR